MNAIWILFWVSSAPSCQFPGTTEWTDRYSIRESSAAIYEWRDTLKSRGKGFNFKIIEGKEVVRRDD
jgi:hypothetical protein